MPRDAEENLPEETGIEEKASSVHSLDEDHKYPISMTDSGNLGFFLEQTTPVWRSCKKFPGRRLRFSQLLHPSFLTVPFFCFQD